MNTSQLPTKSKKISISQRWSAETLDTVKRYAEMMEISQTQYTVEAIQLYAMLVEKIPRIRNLKKEQRFNYVDSILRGDLPKQETVDGKEPVRGLIIEKIHQFLINHENKPFTTTQLAKLLQVPQSTVRAYIRKLEKRDPKIQIIFGKPNSVIYIP